MWYKKIETAPDPFIPSVDIQHMDGMEYLNTIDNGIIDLILTDPPYIISKDSGMNKHYNSVKFNEENNLKFTYCVIMYNNRRAFIPFFMFYIMCKWYIIGVPVYVFF